MQAQRAKAGTGGRGRPSRRAAGFTLVELMIGVAILALALTLGLPSMSAWLQSNQIRNAAESVQNGLQLTKAEAVRRNTGVQFTLSSLAGTAAADWSVTCVTPSADCPGAGMTQTEIQKYSAMEGAPAARVSAPQATIVFTGLGRVSPAANIAIDITNPNAGTCAASGGNMRCLRVVVSAGGHIRMCDPALPSSNPRGC